MQDYTAFNSQDVSAPCQAIQTWQERNEIFPACREQFLRRRSSQERRFNDGLYLSAVVLVLWFWLSRPYWNHFDFKYKFYLGIKGSLGAEAAALACLLLDQAQLGPKFISYDSDKVIWYDSRVEVAVVWSYRLKRRQRRSFSCAEKVLLVSTATWMISMPC